jgi:hypothetical protein
LGLREQQTAQRDLSAIELGGKRAMDNVEAVPRFPGSG